MRSTRRSPLPASLARAQGRFEAWRRARGKRSLIPERLWRMAVRLAGKFGVHPVSKALRVNYERLKAGTEGRIRVARGAEGEGPAFVDLGKAQPLFSALSWPVVQSMERGSL